MAAVAGALTPGERDWLYCTAVAFGERGFGGPTGPHALWLAPARLIHLLHWADTRAGGPIGSGRTLSQLRGLEPEAVVRHLNYLAGRFRQDEQFAGERDRAGGSGRRRGSALTGLGCWTASEAWVANLMDINVAGYHQLREFGVTPVQMMRYLRTVNVEPVGLHVPGLGADGVPLHQAGTADLVDLVDLVMVLGHLPEGEMRAAAEGAGLALSMGPFLLRLARTLRLEPGQLRLLRVMREPESVRSARGAVTTLPSFRFPEPPTRTGRACLHASGSPRVLPCGQPVPAAESMFHGVGIRAPRQR